MFTAAGWVTNSSITMEISMEAPPTQQYIKGSVSSHMDISTVMFNCYTSLNNKEIERVDDVNQQMNGNKYGIYTKKYFTQSQRETK